ncbi:DUF5009 domain-containing protein [Mucilaginibacter robiniae]|uniref:DUF5009 domain-containing protein n=1 Tax=Mucilaginibacter robiniae TaxID=2728022 RepID=A0A7L5DXY1_9SPHI|nr:DUF5009 domain-containing protein [Mucilaginibacter robiniae]QJD95865.1 DUF5009 domain-containing protein [Mucilaginibacter robiniae]
MSSNTLQRRLLSLDFFRGFTVAAMILVNNPGDWGHIFPPLEHAAWNGCTLADLIFPFFLFIMGVSIVYALESKKADATNHKALMLKVLRRSCIILAIGLFRSIYWFWDIHTVRIPGVLQRIAVVYLVIGFIYIKTNYRVQAALLLIILVGYYLLLTQVPVPGIGHASLQAETNLGAWLDRTLFGTAHLWQASKTWDPEGLLSSLPAVGTGMLGLLTGTWLKRSDQPNTIKVYALLVAGLVLVIAGLLWNYSFPLNKSIWTSSFVLFTGGLAMWSLTLCYWLIDIQGYRRFTKPMVVYGVNAILVYVSSELIARTMDRLKVDYQGESVSLKEALYDAFFDSYFVPGVASFLWSLCFVLVWLIILWTMYNRKIFIKI